MSGHVCPDCGSPYFDAGACLLCGRTGELDGPFVEYSPESMDAFTREAELVQAGLRIRVEFDPVLDEPRFLERLSEVLAILSVPGATHWHRRAVIDLPARPGGEVLARIRTVPGVVRVVAKGP